MMKNEKDRLAATPFRCGRCLPCRIQKSREWQHRLLLELSTCPDACFVTLTYNDDHLPPEGVKKEELQKFMKRLRRRTPRKIRYYAVGEYGDNHRAHYHLALFGISYFHAPQVALSWKDENNQDIGFIHVGDLNKKTANYITGYVLKKMTKKWDPRLKGLNPEFMLCSKMGGGLGTLAISKIVDQLKTNPHQDKIKAIINSLTYGRKNMPLGRYLTKKMAELRGIDYETIKQAIFDYQEELFEKYEPGPEAVHQILHENESKVISVKKKHEIFKQRKKL